ncbi:MAG: recombinase family protein [Lachnospiraceae bacterium]
MQNNNYVVAGYYRLSLEDDNIQGDSSSIITQREIIQKYVKAHDEISDCEFLEFYDDGYSGSNMKRPGITQMLELVKQQKISCIIVKDFSRFSRDYIELGSYLEQIFPFTGVRFISISDNYDSSEYIGKTSDLDVEFKGLIADFYCKEMSQKVKNAYRQKWKEGKRVPTSAPFGYKRDPKNKYGLVIEAEEAKVVRRIFQMKLDGIGTLEMCKILNEEGIYTAGEFKRLRGGMTKESIFTNKASWGKAGIRNVLINRVYTGVAEYGKTYSVEIRGRNQKLNPDEWGVIENYHKAIISVDDYNKVQNLIVRKPVVKGTTISEALKGKLVCGGCGKKIQMRRNKQGGSIYCATRSIKEDHECLKGTIRIREIETVLLGQIKKQLENLVDTTLIQQEIKQKHEKTLTKLRQELQSCIAKEKEVHQNQTKNYERYKEGVLNRNDFMKSKKTYEADILVLQEQKEVVKVKLKEMSTLKVEQPMSIEQIMQYSDMQVLNRDMMDSFVEEVRIYQEGRMVIYWKFNGQTSTQMLEQQYNSITYYL